MIRKKMSKALPMIFLIILGVFLIFNASTVWSWESQDPELAKDWEKTIASAEAWITIAHIRTVTRRLARHCYIS